MLRAGIAEQDRVRLLVPENPRLDGALATVRQLTSWGAYVETKAAATGMFRALYCEMVSEGGNGGGYTGDLCDQCGSVRMRRNGSCLLCDDCGSTTGCS